MALALEDYLGWDATEMAHLVRTGEVSEPELTETALAQLDRWRHLNAVAATVADPLTDSLAGALTGGPDEQASTDGRPFAGVPFAVKELLAWPGLPWTMGSRLLAANPAPAVSPYAARLSGAGLRVLCSTTSSEFGLLGSTETALHGVTANPWGARWSAGGSSGGSAALVAAGVLPMAHGSDAGGSLRVPAALNGVFGFAPSTRRCVPTGPDLPGLSALIVDHVITRSVRDSARLLAVTQRTDADSLHPPVHPPLHQVDGPGPRRLRVGLQTTSLTGREPDAAVRRELDRCVVLLHALGHEVQPVATSPVDGAALSEAFFGAAAQTMAAVAQMTAQTRGYPPGEEEIEPFTAALVAWAAELGPGAAGRSERALAEAGRAYLTLFTDHDVLLSPTLCVPSWPIGHLAPDAGRDTLIRRTEEAVGYTPAANAAGCPAMSVPLGQNEGRPIGMHLVAPPGDDARLLRLAFELEEAAPWAGRRPPPPPARS